MKRITTVLQFFALLLAFSGILSSCEENDPLDAAQNPDPIITDIGMPTGELTNASVGPSGGTLSSADGKLTITIPAGALASATDISIQTISNKAPSGLGFGYRLQPEGTTFSMPVELTFHYDNALLQQSPQDFLWIATQAADRSWNAMLTSELDTNAKTVTVTTTHFSDWVLARFIDITLASSASVVQTGESVQLAVIAYFFPLDSQEMAPIAPFDWNNPDLQPIAPLEFEWDRFRIKQWTLNGVVAPVSNSHGSLNASGGGATYTAPNQVPANNPVAVTVQLDCENKTGGSITFFLTSNITVVGDEEYLLVRIDGQEYNYYYGTDSIQMYCFVMDGYFQILANIDADHNYFNLAFENPSVTTRILNGPTGDDSNFAFFPNASSNYAMSYEQRTIQIDESCVRTEQYGSATATLTEYTGTVGSIARGTFSGTLYEDNNQLDMDCAMPIAHSIEGEFVLKIAP